MSGPAGAAQEVEARLALCGPSPERVAGEVAELPELAGYRLGAARRRVLRDTYLDTPHRSLSRARIALRVRQSEDGAVYTMKGPDRGDTEGIAQRDEIELPCSPESLRRLLDELRDRGVRDVQPPPGAAPDDPLAALEGCGLRVIQDRETTRRTRDAVRDGSRPVAEIAIDRVRHRLDAAGAGPRDALIFEIEVELRPAGSLEALQQILSALESHYGSEVRRWPHDKLASGLALATIARSEGVEGLLTPAGALHAEGFDAIDRHLREHPAA